VTRTAPSRPTASATDGNGLRDILDESVEQIAAQLEVWGERPFRARQIWQWLYRHVADRFSAMDNLPVALRRRLAETYSLQPLRPLLTEVSADRLSRKVLFSLPDGATIEAVLMFYRKRRTLCISTQAGCAMGCPFCATGLGGFVRNLTPGEIIAQVLYFARWLDDPQADGPAAAPVPRPTRVTNIVFMGMGEPFANYDAVWTAIRRLTDDQGFNLAARHMTISTVGLVPGIRRMAQEPLQVNLAISLHAPNDALRDRLIPVNQRYPLTTLLAAVRAYIAATNRRVTFEYAMMRDLNDSPALAEALARLLQGMLAHVNLIPLNPVAGSLYQPSSAERIRAFLAVLRAHHIPATLRLRRGVEIGAGCGQLKRAQQMLAFAASDSAGDRRHSG